MRTIAKFRALFVVLLFQLAAGQGFCADDGLSQGLAALEKKQYDKAIEAFSKALETGDTRLEIYNNRGIAWTQKGEYQRAMADYDKALKINPDCAETFNNRGAVWFKKGEYDRAIRDYDRALQINSRFHEAYANRGAAWCGKGNRGRAVSDYKKALEITPDSVEIREQLSRIESFYESELSGQEGRKPSQKRATTVPDINTEGLLSRESPENVSGEGGKIIRGKSFSRDLEAMGLSEGLQVSVTSSKASFCVQVGAFQSKENADALTKRLKKNGYDAQSVPMLSWKKQWWRTVRIGDYGTRQAAQVMAQELLEKEDLKPIVRPVGEW